jgi:hypothetical protein
MHFNIALPSTPRSSMLSLSIRFSIRKLVCNFLFPSVCNMPCRSHPSWFDHRNKIWWTIQISEALHNAVFSSHLFLPLSSFPDTFLNTLFCNSFNLYSFVSMIDHVFEFLLWNVKQFRIVKQIFRQTHPMIHLLKTGYMFRPVWVIISPNYKSESVKTIKNTEVLFYTIGIPMFT